jgi:uncharacterized protein YecE (DUF72 family)
VRRGRRTSQAIGIPEEDAAMRDGRGYIRIGCSGYDYDHWTGVLYDEHLPCDQRFAAYADLFQCVEINNTFYNLPDAATVDDWRQRAHNGFKYAVKMSRYGTHSKRLRDPHDWLNNFFRVIDRLGDTLGPVLVQLPPNWKADPNRLDAFLDAAPNEHRYVVEFRDADWLCDECLSVLESHGAALCVHDLLPDHPHELTSDFAYFRFHGPRPDKPYTGDYSPQFLTARADEFADLARRGADVYVFFNNDEGGAAVRNATRLQRYLDGSTKGAQARVA